MKKILLTISLYNNEAFSLFKKNGIFDKKTSSSFSTNVLKKENTEYPMILFARFRSQEPSVDALLRRSGINN